MMSRVFAVTHDMATRPRNISRAHFTITTRNLHDGASKFFGPG